MNKYKFRSGNLILLFLVSVNIELMLQSYFSKFRFSRDLRSKWNEKFQILAFFGKFLLYLFLTFFWQWILWILRISWGLGILVNGIWGKSYLFWLTSGFFGEFREIFGAEFFICTYFGRSDAPPSWLNFTGICRLRAWMFHLRNVLKFTYFSCLMYQKPSKVILKNPHLIFSPYQCGQQPMVAYVGSHIRTTLLVNMIFKELEIEVMLETILKKWFHPIRSKIYVRYWGYVSGHIENPSIFFLSIFIHFHKILNDLT